MPKPEPATQGRESEEQVQRGWNRTGVTTLVEVQVEVVVRSRHRMAEPVRRYRELDGHEKGVGGCVEPAVPVLDNVVHDLRIGDALQEVMQDDMLIVLT